MKMRRLGMAVGDRSQGFLQLFGAHAKPFGYEVFVFSYAVLCAEEDLRHFGVREADEDEHTNANVTLRKSSLLQFGDDAGQQFVAESGELAGVIPMELRADVRRLSEKAALGVQGILAASGTEIEPRGESQKKQYCRGNKREEGLGFQRRRIRLKGLPGKEHGFDPFRVVTFQRTPEIRACGG